MLIIYGPRNIDKTSPNTILFSIVKLGEYPKKERICNIKLRDKLFKKHKIIISIGSACNTTSSSPSHVLTAVKAPFLVRSGTMRVSFNDYNTLNEVNILTDAIITEVNNQLENNHLEDDFE